MKKRQTKQKNAKKRIFKYFSKKIIIKSEIKLSKRERKNICNIVNYHLSIKSYGFEEKIPKEIFHKMKEHVSSVEFYATKFMYVVVKINRT